MGLFVVKLIGSTLRMAGGWGFATYVSFGENVHLDQLGGSFIASFTMERTNSSFPVV
jgi:hypothetical protein